MKKRRRGRSFGVRVHNHLIDRVAVINGFVSGAALYPQLVKGLVSGNFAALSAISLIIILLNNIVWVLYSLHRGLVSLIIASALNVVAALLLLLLVSL